MSVKLLFGVGVEAAEERGEVFGEVTRIAFGGNDAWCGAEEFEVAVLLSEECALA